MGVPSDGTPKWQKHFAPNFWNKPGINCQKSNIVNRWEIHRIIDSDNELLSLTSSSSSSQSSSNLLILVSYWKNIIFSQIVPCWESCSIRNSFLNSENGTNKGHQQLRNSNGLVVKFNFPRSSWGIQNWGVGIDSSFGLPVLA